MEKDEKRIRKESEKDARAKSGGNKGRIKRMNRGKGKENSRRLWIKLLCALLAVFLTAAGLAACSCAAGTQGETEEQTLDWQEQYDLGIRLLNEGKYEEAILAFTAAIDIAPRQAALYVARGDAYLAWANALQNEAAAAGEEADGGSVQTLDGTTVKELYENALEDYREAVDLIESGEAEDGSDELLQEAQEKLEQTEELLGGAPNETGEGAGEDGSADGEADGEEAVGGTEEPQTRRPTGYLLTWVYGEEEQSGGQRQYVYDEQGRFSQEIQIAEDGTPGNSTYYYYDAAGNSLPSAYVYEAPLEYDENGLVTAVGWEDGTVTDRILYDAEGRLSEIQFMFDQEGNPAYYQRYFYDGEGRLERTEFYNQGGSNLSDVSEYRYNSDGKVEEIVTTTYYGSGQTGTGRERYEYDSEGRLLRSETSTGGEVYIWADYVYDADGTLVQENHGTIDMEIGSPYRIDYLFEEP